MKSKSNGSSDRDSSNGKYEKNGGMNDDSMSGGEDRSRSGSPSRLSNNPCTLLNSSGPLFCFHSIHPSIHPLITYHNTWTLCWCVA